MLYFIITSYQVTSILTAWEHSYSRSFTNAYLYDGQSFKVLGELTSRSSSGHDNRFGHQFGSSSHVGQLTPSAEYLTANGMLIERTALSDPYSRSATSYYTQDILGSTLQLTDRGGRVSQTYAYTAFGSNYQGQLNQTNPFGYTGKRYDPVAGLYDYGFRDYTPAVGRWTTSDPIRAGLNWYAYVNESPTNFVDHHGLAKTDLNAGGNGMATTPSAGAMLKQKIEGGAVFVGGLIVFGGGAYVGSIGAMYIGLGLMAAGGAMYTDARNGKKAGVFSNGAFNAVVTNED